ncbi:35681_t:CDS:1, partial [Gigaspora margarita]
KSELVKLAPMVPLKGNFQIKNAAIAILTSDLLKKKEPKFSIIANYYGIACTQ